MVVNAGIVSAVRGALLDISVLPIPLEMITPTAQGDDYAEAAWQRKLRYQANRKKRGRKL